MDSLEVGEQAVSAVQGCGHRQLLCGFPAQQALSQAPLPSRNGRRLICTPQLSLSISLSSI